MTNEARALAETFGGIWAEHPRYPVEAWRYDVAEDNTRASYWDWVLAAIEAAAE
jgi:hypothetical protein